MKVYYSETFPLTWLCPHMYYVSTSSFVHICMYVLCIYKFLCPHMYVCISVSTSSFVHICMYVCISVSTSSFVLYLSVLIFPCYISAALLVSTQLGSIRAIIKELSYPTVCNIIVYNYYNCHLSAYGQYLYNSKGACSNYFCRK